MTGLLPISEAARLLGCRDTRTARKRLALLAVPVLVLGGRMLVDADELRHGIARAGAPEHAPAPTGIALPPGARLWD